MKNTTLKLVYILMIIILVVAGDTWRRAYSVSKRNVEIDDTIRPLRQQIGELRGELQELHQISHKNSVTLKLLENSIKVEGAKSEEQAEAAISAVAVTPTAPEKEVNNAVAVNPTILEEFVESITTTRVVVGKDETVGEAPAKAVADKNGEKPSMEEAAGTEVLSDFMELSDLVSTTATERSAAVIKEPKITEKAAVAKEEETIQIPGGKKDTVVAADPTLPGGKPVEKQVNQGAVEKSGAKETTKSAVASAAAGKEPEEKKVYNVTPDDLGPKPPVHEVGAEETVKEIIEREREIMPPKRTTTIPAVSADTESLVIDVSETGEISEKKPVEDISIRSTVTEQLLPGEAGGKKRTMADILESYTE